MEADSIYEWRWWRWILSMSGGDGGGFYQFLEVMEVDYIYEWRWWRLFLSMSGGGGGGFYL